MCWKRRWRAFCCTCGDRVRASASRVQEGVRWKAKAGRTLACDGRCVRPTCVKRRHADYFAARGGSAATLAERGWRPLWMRRQGAPRHSRSGGALSPRRRRGASLPAIARPASRREAGNSLPTAAMVYPVEPFKRLPPGASSHFDLPLYMAIFAESIVSKVCGLKKSWKSAASFHGQRPDRAHLISVSLWNETGAVLQHLQQQHGEPGCLRDL